MSEQGFVNPKEIPEPESQKVLRAAAIELLSMINDGEVTAFTVVGEHADGSPFFLSSGSENIFAQFGFAMCHYIDRAMTVYSEGTQMFGVAGEDDDSPTDEELDE